MVQDRTIYLQWQTDRILYIICRIQWSWITPNPRFQGHTIIRRTVSQKRYMIWPRHSNSELPYDISSGVISNDLDWPLRVRLFSTSNNSKMVSLHDTAMLTMADQRLSTRTRRAEVMLYRGAWLVPVEQLAVERRQVTSHRTGHGQSAAFSDLDRLRRSGWCGAASRCNTEVARRHSRSATDI